MFVIHIWISVLIIPSFQVGIKGKLCPEAMALTYDRNPEFPVDPRLSTVVFKRKRPVGRPRAPGLALSRTPPRVREDAAYVRTGQEVEHYPRMDLEDINVDEMEEGEITEDEFLEPREAEEEPMGGQEDLGNEDEVGGDREFLEAGEAEGTLLRNHIQLERSGTGRFFSKYYFSYIYGLLHCIFKIFH